MKRRKKRSKNVSQEAQNRQKKMQQIQDVLSSTPLDLEVLRKLAIGDGGLVKGKQRTRWQLECVNATSPLNVWHSVYICSSYVIDRGKLF